MVYFLFDSLWCEGRDLIGKTVLQRRERLQEIIHPVTGIQVGGYIENRGIDLFRLAKEKGLEGIIAKRKTSIYQPGKRSADWLKIKARPQHEFVVGGFTEGKGSHEPAEVICDDCDSSAEGESDQNEVESARSCIPSSDLLASSWSLPSLVSGCAPHKDFKPPSQQAEAPRAASIPETKNLFPLRFDSLGSDMVPETELKLPCDDNRIF